MDELAKKLPEYDVVSKMGGIYKKLRPKIIAEIGDIRKYKQAGSLIGIAGLDTPPYQSENLKADNIHISKSSKPTKDIAVYE